MSHSSPLSQNGRGFIEQGAIAAQEVTVHADFAQLPQDAACLFEAAAQRHGFFLRRSWFANLVAHGGVPGGACRIYVLRDATGGKPTLALPLQASTDRFGTRTLSALTNWYSSFYAPLATEESGNLTRLQRMLQCIANERPRWDRIELRPMDPESPLFTELIAALRGAGMAVQSYWCFTNWTLQVQGRSYEEYARSLPSTLRNTLKRKGRQLERSGRASLRIVTGSDGLEEGIAAYLAVYRNSWKSPEPTPEFMPSLIRLCAREGWLRLGVAHIDGEPAAAQLWIVCHGVASIYKLAYDERYAALSIGSLLTAHMMQHAIDVDRVREVDYLTGDDAYKRDWMSHARERRGLVAYNLRSPRGLALAAVNFAGGRLKRLMRRMRGG